MIGDNQKEQLGIEPIIQRSAVECESLFGDTEDLELIDNDLNDYQLANTESILWLDPRTYMGMYDMSQVVGYAIEMEA